MIKSPWLGYKKFQSMNETMCSIKGTMDADWGHLCVLAVGDLYQLPPVGQCPVYMSPHAINTLNDFAPNGWETVKSRELTQCDRKMNSLRNVSITYVHMFQNLVQLKTQCYNNVN